LSALAERSLSPWTVLWVRSRFDSPPEISDNTVPTLVERSLSPGRGLWVRSSEWPDDTGVTQHPFFFLPVDVYILTYCCLHVPPFPHEPVSYSFSCYPLSTSGFQAQFFCWVTGDISPKKEEVHTLLFCSNYVADKPMAFKLKEE